jgi:hypothetical protein
MDEIRLAGGAGLALMVFEGKIVGLADDLQIIARTVFGDLAQQLLEPCSQQLQLFLRGGLRICRHKRL